MEIDYTRPTTTLYNHLSYAHKNSASNIWSTPGKAEEQYRQNNAESEIEWITAIVDDICQQQTMWGISWLLMKPSGHKRLRKFSIWRTGVESIHDVQIHMNEEGKHLVL